MAFGTTRTEMRNSREGEQKNPIWLGPTRVLILRSRFVEFALIINKSLLAANANLRTTF